MYINPLPTIGNSVKKQKSLYKVLMPSIKPPYKFLWAYGSYASLVGKGLTVISSCLYLPIMVALPVVPEGMYIL